MELVKSNNILQSIIGDSAEAIFIKDRQGRYLIINELAANWLGLKVEEIIGQDDTTLFDPEIAEGIIKMDREVIDRGKVLSYEEKITFPGKQRSLLTSKYPWRNNTGEILGIIGITRDVTVLKESAQKLNKNEQLLRLALSNANAGSWTWEIATGEITWSPETYNLYGVVPQKQSLQYQDWNNALHPEDRQWIEEEVQQVILGQLPEFNCEFRIIHPQRGVRWLLCIANITHNQQGEPISLSGIDLDITERKLTEEKLRHSEQHLRRVLDSLYTFVGVMTPEGILIEINRPALEVANLQPEDVIGKPFPETYWWSYSPEIQTQLKNTMRKAARGESCRYEVKVRLGEDKYITVDFSLVPLFDDNGEVEYLIPSGIDISDREKSKQALHQREDELKLITEVIPQQIWTASSDGKIDYINQGWRNYTGLSLAEIQARGWSTIVHVDDLQRVKETWNQAIESEREYNIEARLRHKNGAYRWFLVRARPLRNKQSKIVKWYGTNTEITRIKELEEKLRQQTEDLIRANQLKDEFLAIVSHELRTPLNPILGWSQLFSAGRLDAEKTAQGLEVIKRNAELQAQLIEDLLDVSRILRGKLNLQVAPLDLETVIKAALATVELAAEAKSIQIETVFEPNIGQVLGDAGRLQQIVWNLVSNAIKFTPLGGRVIVTLELVEAQVQQQNSSSEENLNIFYAQIKVKDTGKGIKPEFLPHVFERFSQGESSSKRSQGGLGLGLAIVRYLTELHGGTVAADSAGEGQGATFKVKLPLPKAPEIEQENREVRDESVELAPLNGIHILVVDDRTDSLELLTLVLEQEGATVTAVASATEALEALNQSSFDLVISDIGMPEVDGYSLLAQIRQLPQGKDLPAIALTAYAASSDRQNSIDAGFNEHISKPVDLPNLIATVIQLIRSR